MTVDAKSALKELSMYMNMMFKFCKEKELNYNSAKIKFIMKYIGPGVYTEEYLNNVDNFLEFWDYLILEHEFMGKNVREMFVEEHKELPDDVKDELLKMKSICDFFIVEKIDKDKKEIVLRRIYTDERYHIWTEKLLDSLHLNDLIKLRIIFWRGYIFPWGVGEIYEKKLSKMILSHEEFLKELEKDILSFLEAERKIVSPRTYRRREACLWDFYDFIRENPKINSYKRFNKTLIKRYLKWLGRIIGISRSYIKDSLTSVRKFFNYLVDIGKLDKNPAKDIYVP